MKKILLPGRLTALLLALLLTLPVVVPGADPLVMTLPRANETAPWLFGAVGHVADPKAQVWAVVHAVGSKDYWLQRRGMVNPDGSWKVIVGLGADPKKDAGRQYELRVFANLKKELKEGRLTGWPEAQWSTPAITLTQQSPP